MRTAPHQATALFSICLGSLAAAGSCADQAGDPEAVVQAVTAGSTATGAIPAGLPGRARRAREKHGRELTERPIMGQPTLVLLILN